MPKSYCPKTADFFLAKAPCNSNEIVVHGIFFLSISMNPPDLFHKLHLEEAISQHNGKIATVVIS